MTKKIHFLFSSIKFTIQIYFRMKAAENLAAFKSELVEAVKEEKVRID